MKDKKNIFGLDGDYMTAGIDSLNNSNNTGSQQEETQAKTKPIRKLNNT